MIKGLKIVTNIWFRFFPRKYKEEIFEPTIHDLPNDIGKFMNGQYTNNINELIQTRGIPYKWGQ